MSKIGLRPAEMRGERLGERGKASGQEGCQAEAKEGGCPYQQGE